MNLYAHMVISKGASRIVFVFCFRAKTVKKNENNEFCFLVNTDMRPEVFLKMLKLEMKIEKCSIKYVKNYENSETHIL